jgi:hypothetical protein
MAKDQQMTETQIRKVFQQLGLGGSSTGAPVAQPLTQPPSQPLYFPLSADSLMIEK